MRFFSDTTAYHQVKSLAAIALTFLIALDLQAQEALVIPFGSTPSIDGSAAQDEWTAAGMTKIVQESGAEVNVRFLHDGQSLYFIYEGNLQSNGRFPEVLLDVNNDKSSAWDINDWWFHASATDCEMQGAHSIYTNCEETKSTWRAAPNMKMEGPSTDTIEIEIPFGLIGLVGKPLPVTIGLSLEVTNTFSAWEHWPWTAKIDEPSSWGTAILQAPEADVQNGSALAASSPRLRWISTSHLSIDSDDQLIRVELRDALGRSVIKSREQQVDTKLDLDLSGLPPGPYFVMIESSNGIAVEKIKLEELR